MHHILTAFIALGVISTASVASASSILLSPTTVAVTKGETFSVTVNVEPAGMKLYTVKGVVTYPADMLEATSFAFAQGTPMWVPLSQAGYDSMTPGNVTKTAGFPGGFTTVKALGTITFRAKESGTAIIAASPTSIAYDAQSKNTISGTQGSSAVTVAAPVPAPAPTPTAQTQTQGQVVAQTTPRPSQTAGVAATEETEATTTEAATEEAQDSQIAAAGLLGVPWYLWLILVALLGAAGARWYWTRPRQTF